jgi:hypothetical protein
MHHDPGATTALAAFKSEWRPGWNRNGGRLQIGTTGRLRRNPQVSRLCAEIDDRVKAFLDRPIEGDWPYL